MYCNMRKSKSRLAIRQGGTLCETRGLGLGALTDLQMVGGSRIVAREFELPFGIC